MDYEQGAAWAASLPQEARDAYTVWRKLDNAQPSNQGDSRRAEQKYRAMGGDAARLAAEQTLKTQYPDVWTFSQDPANRVSTGGLGQGADLLAMLAMVGGAAGMGLITPAGAAAGSTSGSVLGAGGQLLPSSEAILSGGAGAGQGLSLATLGTPLTEAAANAASAQMSERIARGANSLEAIRSGGTIPGYDSVIPTGTPTPTGAPNVPGTSGADLAPNGKQWMTPGEYEASLGTLGSLAGVAAPIIGGAIGSGAANDAAQISADATAASLAEQQRQFDIGQKNQTPWMDAGKGALTEQQNLMGLGANGSAENSLAALMSSPGYEFRLNQGRRALEASFGGNGGMQSGKAGVAMDEYGQDYASGEYGNRLQQLANLSGTGQSAASGMAAGGMDYANNVTNTTMNNANNQATSGINAAAATQSGIIGAGNALSSLLNPAQQTGPKWIPGKNGQPGYWG